MSEYGRLFQQVADIRREIKKLVPGANTNTLEEARKSCGGSCERLLLRWERLECWMKDVDD
jgi:hypothetical protein